MCSRSLSTSECLSPASLLLAGELAAKNKSETSQFEGRKGDICANVCNMFLTVSANVLACK